MSKDEYFKQSVEFWIKQGAQPWEAIEYATADTLEYISKAKKEGQ
jgi:hypothetical protein